MVLLCLAGLAQAGPSGHALAGEDAEGYRVDPQRIPVTRVVHAEVQSDRRPVARARISGLLRALEVEEGDHVSEDQVIGRVVDPELASRVAAAEAEVARVKARDRRARRDLARARQLFAEKNLSEARLDEARQEAADAANALVAARSRVETLVARRQRGAVLAPAAGPVIEVRPEIGSATRPGMVVARIASEPMALRIAVPERHLPYLEAGVVVTVETPAGPRRATLSKVYPEVVRGRVEADLRLPEGVASVPVGRRLPVTLQIDSVERLLVPQRLVEQRHGLAFVRRAEAGLTLVQLGGTYGDQVAILSEIGRAHV